MKKILGLCLAFVLLVGTSISVYAACEVHVVPSDANWEFQCVVNVKDGGSHPYGKVIDENGNVLVWGTCYDTIYTDQYCKKCVNCGMPVTTKTIQRTEHNRQ